MTCIVSFGTMIIFALLLASGKGIICRATFVIPLVLGNLLTVLLLRSMDIEQLCSAIWHFTCLSNQSILFPHSFLCYGEGFSAKHAKRTVRKGKSSTTLLCLLLHSLCLFFASSLFSRDPPPYFFSMIALHLLLQ